MTSSQASGKPALEIIIDTREQDPYEFQGFKTVRRGLKTGDYSLVGFEDRVAVERKSKIDAWGCVGGGRGRFEACMERLSALDSALVVIECGLGDFCERPAHVKRVTVGTAVGSYISWMCSWKVPVVWCDNRAFAERVVVRFLGAYLKYRAGARGEHET